MLDILGFPGILYPTSQATS